MVEIIKAGPYRYEAVVGGTTLAACTWSSGPEVGTTITALGYEPQFVGLDPLSEERTHLYLTHAALRVLAREARASRKDLRAKEAALAAASRSERRRQERAYRLRVAWKLDHLCVTLADKVIGHYNKATKRLEIFVAFGLYDGRTRLTVQCAEGVASVRRAARALIKPYIPSVREVLREEVQRLRKEETAHNT